MPINFYYFDGSTVTVPDPLPYNGLFIPVSNLPGTIAADFALAVNANVKESKAIYALIQQLNAYLIANTSRLGLSTSLSNPSVINSNTISYNFSFTIDYLLDTAVGRLSMLPTPTTGVYSNIGKFSLSNIFPSLVVIKDKATESNLITGAGILIDVSDLEDYGFYNDVLGSTIATYNATGDCRYSVAALLSAICDGNVSTRTVQTASGILSTSVSAPSIVEVPASYYSATNPLTAINGNDLDHIAITRRTYSISFELNLLPEYLEVNVKTT